MSNKTYVGSGKKAANFDIVNIALSEDKLKDHWYTYEGKRYVKLAIGALREPNAYGKTHSVWIDDYKPEQKQETQQAKAGDGLPF